MCSIEQTFLATHARFTKSQPHASAASQLDAMVCRPNDDFGKSYKRCGSRFGLRICSVFRNLRLRSPKRSLSRTSKTRIFYNIFSTLCPLPTRSTRFGGESWQVISKAMPNLAIVLRISSVWGLERRFCKDEPKMKAASRPRLRLSVKYAWSVVSWLAQSGVGTESLGNVVSRMGRRMRSVCNHHTPRFYNIIASSPYRTHAHTYDVCDPFVIITPRFYNIIASSPDRTYTHTTYAIRL